MSESEGKSMASGRKAGDVERINGWDERDYRLWSALQSLPNYGLIAPGNPMVALADVVKVLEREAEKRFDDAHH